MSITINKRALCQLWQQSADCNLAGNWLFERYEVDAEAFDFAANLPASGLAMIREEVESRLEADADLKARHHAAFLADESPIFLKRLRYDQGLNRAGLDRCREFLARAQRHMAGKCQHHYGKTEVKDIEDTDAD